jgi:pimeloyl-ACP methyl ester carboxylesterase
MISTAAAHFYLMSGRLARLEGSQVTRPLVPAGFGVLGSLNKTYGQIAQNVEKIGQLEPAAKRIVVGHSLGGMLARRLLAEGLADSIVTIGAPHAGLRRIVPKETRIAYSNFSEAIPDTARPGTLALIGSNFDELVPLASSLAPLRNADTHEHSGATTHNLLLLSQGVIDLSMRLVKNMAEAETPQLAESQPEYLPRPA